LGFRDFCLDFYIFYLNFRDSSKKNKKKFLFGFPRHHFKFCTNHKNLTKNTKCSLTVMWGINKSSC
jgi:hypothetical protein